ncbi:methylmalonyl Co-A mutase-associated GTPase MeaB [Desulfospira joergensenii]|uniref:methylmalonyl Co-A mutase-associated GTPase MeaB n=1 Tax=Desulfospira joergensenii TaxID=53329 RepID=UPI0003B36F25|nr:methylmalonyl Co-A mutase-associated GTPase MeaB [Desulfospira joergensenii]
MEVPQFYIRGVLEGNRRILSQTLTLLESSLKKHKELSGKVLEGLLPHTGRSLRLGITGVPGAGKSTFIESLGLDLAEKGHRVAVLAVDPSSQKAGGSILGDKTRMQKLSFHENTFIRPSPSGDTLGGVAAKTRESMLICEAAGHDVILVETVGVGQSEISVAFMVDFFLVLMVAGTGDDLQGIKRGVLEAADAIVVNKADGKNFDGALQARKDLERAVQMTLPESRIWQTPVLACSSVDEKGTRTVWDTILAHQRLMKETRGFEDRRKKQALNWMWALVEEGLKLRLNQNSAVAGMIPHVSDQVSKNLLSPMAAAHKVLELF